MLKDLLREAAEMHRRLSETDAAKNLELLERAAVKRLRIYRCEKCGGFGASERKTRRFCDECK